MTSYLDLILEWTRENRLTQLRRSGIAGELSRKAMESEPTRSFARAMFEPGMSLIAEFKRRSPSAGELKAGADPREHAQAYEAGGARAISVLTEPEFFDGSFQDLTAVKESCSLPVLRKDFLLDPIQVVEARAHSADAVLLIAAAINDRVLFEEMYSASRDMGMDALIEVHQEKELDLVFAVEPDLIGVNQRDLTTFKVDHDLAVRIRKEIPSSVAVVAESGVSTQEQVQRMSKAGVSGVLVGETLMRADDPSLAIKELLREPD